MGIYRAAMETVQLAETRAVDESVPKREFDQAWQEVLNHATQRVSNFHFICRKFIMNQRKPCMIEKCGKIHSGTISGPWLDSDLTSQAISVQWRHQKGCQILHWILKWKSWNEHGYIEVLSCPFNMNQGTSGMLIHFFLLIALLFIMNEQQSSSPADTTGG